MPAGALHVSEGSDRGRSSQSRFEYKIIKCTDRAWINDTKVRIHNLACSLFDTLKDGDIIAFDPMLSNGSRRQCRFDIGQVVKISYPCDIEISVWKSLTSTEYVRKLTLHNIHRDALRFKFVDNPILQNKIVLNEETFTKIAKNFYNGN